MNHALLKQYMQQYLDEALSKTDGTTLGISRYLEDVTLPGRFARHRDEKKQALAELRQAFMEFRHWPLDILLKRLDLKEQASA